MTLTRTDWVSFQETRVGIETDKYPCSVTEHHDEQPGEESTGNLYSYSIPESSDSEIVVTCAPKSIYFRLGRIKSIKRIKPRVIIPESENGE